MTSKPREALDDKQGPGSWETELGGYRLVYGKGSADRLGQLACEIGGT